MLNTSSAAARSLRRSISRSLANSKCYMRIFVSAEALCCAQFKAALRSDFDIATALLEQAPLAGCSLVATSRLRERVAHELLLAQNACVHKLPAKVRLLRKGKKNAVTPHQLLRLSPIASELDLDLSKKSAFA